MAEKANRDASFWFLKASKLLIDMTEEEGVRIQPQLKQLMYLEQRLTATLERLTFYEEMRERNELEQECEEVERMIQTGNKILLQICDKLE